MLVLNARFGASFDVPTEAQWEHACRAGAETPVDGDPDPVAWHRDNAASQTHPVRHRAPNAWGLYDMLGNVYEWTLDSASSVPPDSSRRIDPVEPRQTAGQSDRSRRLVVHARDRSCRAARRYEDQARERASTMLAFACVRNTVETLPRHRT